MYIFSICVSPPIFTPFSNPRVGAFLESFMKEVITDIPRKREPPIFDFDLTKQRQRWSENQKHWPKQE